MLGGILCGTSTFAASPQAKRITIESELANPIILTGTPEKNYLKISLTGFELKNNDERSPINLSLVIDRSTSMSGDKIQKAREAAILAVNMLEATDTVSIIGYDSSAQVILPSTKVDDKKMIAELIKENIRPMGNTALFEGVSKGLKEVKKYLDKNHVNRVILLSDGQANVGPSSTSELAELGRMAGGDGISVTTIGLGAGYNEDLMAALAGYSDGNHVFVENSAQLEKAFSHEFSDVMSVVAQDVDVEIIIKGKVRPVRLLGREGEINGQTVRVRMNQLYSNQEKYVLLEVIPEPGKKDQQKELAEVKVSYRNMASKQAENYQNQVNIRYSDSKDTVQQAVEEEVLAEAIIQESNIATIEAASLVQQGKTKKANQRLRQNAEKLKNVSSSFKDQKVQNKLQLHADKNEVLAEQVQNAPAEVSRKAITEESFKTKKQQK